MTNLTSAVVLAFLVECLVNGIKYIYNDIFWVYMQYKDKKQSKKTETNHYVIAFQKKLYARLLAIILGICLSIFTEVSIMEFFNINITFFDSKQFENLNKILEYIITGLIISRGSNALYDLIKRIKSFDFKKEAEKSDDGINIDSSSVQNEE